MTRLLCAFLFCALPVSIAAAQQQELPRRSCRECTITKEYDRRTNQTQITLQPLPVADVPEGKMYLSVVAGFKGQVAQGTDHVYVIALSFIAKSAPNVSDTKLMALVDGKREAFGNLALTGRATGGERQTFTYSKLTDRSLISKLGRAHSVEMRFGGAKFQLTAEQRIALLDFLDDLDGNPPTQT